MTAFAAVVIDDAASAASTFAPSAIDQNGVARLYEANDNFDARRALSLGVRLPAKGSQVARVTFKVVIPVMDAVEPTLKVGEAIFNGEFVIPKRASVTNREDLLSFARNYLADASAVAAVHDLESVY